jgi:hypothetical protein
MKRKLIICLSIACLTGAAFAKRAIRPVEPPANPPAAPASPLAVARQFIALAKAGDSDAMSKLVRDADDANLRDRLALMVSAINLELQYEPLEEIVDGDVAAVLIRGTQGERSKVDSISLVQTGGEWRILLEPNAPGIDPDQLKRLGELRQSKVQPRRRELNAAATQPAATQPGGPTPPPPAQ